MTTGTLRRSRSTKSHAPVHTRGIRWVPTWLIMVLVAMSTIYPVVFVFLTAFKTELDYSSNKLGLPSDWTLGNIEAVNANTELVRYAFNSLLVVAFAVLLTVITATMAGYAVTRLGLSVRIAATILLLIVALMMLPKAVLMVPMVRITRQLGILNTFHGLMFVYAAIQLPISIYMMSAYFRGVPMDLLAAARLDGATEMRAFWHIAIPLVRPGLLVVSTLNFLWLWNELLFSLLLLNDGSKRTLMVGLATLRGQHTTPIPELAAGMLIGMTPPLILFALLQRRLAEGLTAGALK